MVYFIIFYNCYEKILPIFFIYDIYLKNPLFLINFYIIQVFREKKANLSVQRLAYRSDYLLQLTCYTV